MFRVLPRNCWKEFTLPISVWLVGRILAHKDLVEYVLGTISGKLDEDTFITKPQDRDYLRLWPWQYVRVNLRGDPLERSKSRPSLNWLVHRACYEADHRIGGVVHAHLRSTVAFTSQTNPHFDSSFSRDGMPFVIPLLTEEAVWLLNPAEDSPLAIPIVEDLDPVGLAQKAREIIPKVNVFAIRNHGIMTVGRDIWEALGIALVIKKEAEMLLDIYTSGGRPELRTEERIRTSLKTMPPHFRWRNYNGAVQTSQDGGLLL